MQLSNTQSISNCQREIITHYHNSIFHQHCGFVRSLLMNIDLRKSEHSVPPSTPPWISGEDEGRQPLAQRGPRRLPFLSTIVQLVVPAHLAARQYVILEAVDQLQRDAQRLHHGRARAAKSICCSRTRNESPSSWSFASLLVDKQAAFDLWYQVKIGSSTSCKNRSSFSRCPRAPEKSGFLIQPIL